MKPLHNVIFDLLKDIEKYSLPGFANIILNNIIFSIIDIKKIQPNSNNVNCKQSDYENIPPLLPVIQSNYLYTLVLDLDETLIHYFYVI